MRVSARSNYACEALLELSFHWPDKEPIPIHTISEKQDIPLRYLVHILIQLKRMGLVESIRGKQGGYILAKVPDAISLGAVIRDLGGPLLPRPGILGRGNRPVKNISVFASIWEEVEEAMAKVLDRITFGDILKKAKGLERAIVYQI